jgi:hypothetical protein
MRRMLIRDLRDMQSTPLVKRMYARARIEGRLVYDTTNVNWVVAQFRPKANRNTQPPGVPLRIVNKPPAFSSADHARVLARLGDKNITLGDFIEQYSHIPAVFRRPIISLEPFTYTFESIFLGPVLAEMAVTYGLDRDPMSVMQIEERREKLLVDRVYADSIENRIRIDETLRRAEYDRELKSGELETPLTVRFALIIRHTAAGADSVTRMLKSGVPADSIVAHDLRMYGKGVSQMHDAVYGQPNTYSVQVFEELKPGQSTTIGPDSENKYMVIHVQERREAHTPTYDEAIAAIDESARNVEADRLFRTFLERHRHDFPVVTHPELLSRVNMSDPLMD